MKLYLDNCCFNRPFDNQTQIRIRLETEAKLKIQEEIRLGNFKLVWSYILDYRPNRFYKGGYVMITDTEIKLKGLEILAKHLGDVDAERFISLIQKETFDYTKWRQGLNEENLSVEEISQRAMTFRKKASLENEESEF